jgi:hypothetical protein
MPIVGPAVRRISECSEFVCPFRQKPSVWHTLRALGRPRQAQIRPSSRLDDGMNASGLSLGVAQLCRDKYRNLLCSVSHDQSDIEIISDRIGSHLSNVSFKADRCHLCFDVKTAVTRLKRDKSDVNNLLLSDYFIFATEKE